MKNILLISFHNLNHTAFRILLEIAQIHKLKNDTLNFLSCKGVLPYCTCNQQHQEKNCFYCQSRLREAQKILSIPNENIFFVKNYPTPNFKFSSMEELRHIDIDGINIGKGVVINTISKLMDHKFCVEKNKILIGKLISSSTDICKSFTSLIQKKHFDFVHILMVEMSQNIP